MKPLWPSWCLAQACVENSEAPKWIGCQHDFILLGRSVCRTNFTGAWEGAHADFGSNSIFHKGWPRIFILLPYISVL